MVRRFECNRKPAAQRLEGRVQSGTETGAGLTVQGYAGLGAGAGAAVELEYEVSDREEVTFNASDRESILARLLAWMNSESTETNRDHISRLLNAPGMLETCLKACQDHCNTERNQFLLSVLDEMQLGLISVYLRQAGHFEANAKAPVAEVCMGRLSDKSADWTSDKMVLGGHMHLYSIGLLKCGEIKCIGPFVVGNPDDDTQVENFKLAVDSTYPDQKKIKENLRRATKRLNSCIEKLSPTEPTKPGDTVTLQDHRNLCSAVKIQIRESGSGNLTNSGIGEELSDYTLWLERWVDAEDLRDWHELSSVKDASVTACHGYLVLIEAQNPTKAQNPIKAVAPVYWRLFMTMALISTGLLVYFLCEF